MHTAHYYSWEARLARIKGREEEVVKRYLAGENTRRIADDLDVYHFDVLNCLIKLGVKLRDEDKTAQYLKGTGKAIHVVTGSRPPRC